MPQDCAARRRAAKARRCSSLTTRSNIVATNRRMLEKNGYRVLTANNGQQALEVYKQNRPDIELVVTDIMMPGMDGMGLIRALQGHGPGTSKSSPPAGWAAASAASRAATRGRTN